MRKKPFRFLQNSAFPQSRARQSNAFTLLELILVILILGVVAYQALPRFIVQESLCFYELRSSLGKANDRFLELYRLSIMQNQKLDLDSVWGDLLTQKQKSCYFERKNHRLIAHIGKKTLAFTISPQDFSAKPKIYCQISNELCRKFWGRELKK